jgi:hypothetical protein
MVFTSSVVVLVIEQDHVCAFKFERQPPHAIDSNRPVPRKIGLQRMEIPSSAIGIIGCRSHVQNSELFTQPVSMLGLDTGFAPGSKELFETLMLETFDYSIECIAYRYTYQEEDSLPSAAKVARFISDGYLPNRVRASHCCSITACSRDWC